MDRTPPSGVSVKEPPGPSPGSGDPSFIPRNEEENHDMRGDRKAEKFLRFRSLVRKSRILLDKAKAEVEVADALADAEYAQACSAAKEARQRDDSLYRDYLRDVASCEYLRNKNESLRSKLAGLRRRRLMESLFGREEDDP